MTDRTAPDPITGLRTFRCEPCWDFIAAHHASPDAAHSIPVGRTETEESSHQHEFQCLTCDARFRRGERVQGEAEQALAALPVDDDSPAPHPDPLTPEELAVLPRMRLDLDAKRYDAYRPEDVGCLLDIIDRLDRAYRVARGFIPSTPIPSPDTDLRHLIRKDETDPYAEGWNDAVRSIQSLLSSSESTETPTPSLDVEALLRVESAAKELMDAAGLVTLDSDAHMNCGPDACPVKALREALAARLISETPTPDPDVREFQIVEDGEAPYCPACGAYPGEPHASDCAWLIARPTPDPDPR